MVVGMDISNRGLALLLVVAVVVSLGGTIVSLNRLNELGFTGQATANSSGTAQFALSTNVVVTFTSATVNFGTGYVNGTTTAYCNLTTTTSWNQTGGCAGELTNSTPFYLRNDGNIDVNLSLQSNATAWQFISGGGGTFQTPIFQWQLTNNQTNACSLNLQPTAWTNVNTTENQTVCEVFQWIDTNDTLRLDIMAVVPINANQTAHSALITATGWV